MKNMRKVAILLLALALALSLAIPVFAADTKYSITINKTDTNSTDPHVYQAYQIFAGDLSDEANPDSVDGTNAVLSNITWGSGVEYTGTGVVVGQDDDGKDIYSTEASDVAAALAAGTLSLNDFVADLTLGTPCAASEEGDDAYVIAGLAPGYYLVKDAESVLDKDTATEIILEVVENSVVNPKAETVVVEKKIDDKNDSNTSEDEIQWHDSADHDIGDLIDFKLTTTIPSSFNLFVTYGEAYPFTFHDTEEKGLTFQPDTVKVYVDDTEITDGYEVKVPGSTHNEGTDDEHTCTFEVIFTDLTKIDAVKAGSVITVLYKSELNEDAILGDLGNVNEVYGEFRNFYEPDVPKFTPKDTVIAFTYKVVVNKVDENGAPLAGAEFTLEKFVANAEGTETHENVTGNWVAIEKVETTSGTTFTFTGLDDGEYRLCETVTPKGYNSIDDIYFTVTADHDILWTEERTDVLNSLTGNVVTGELSFTVIDEIYGEGEEEVTSTNAGLSSDVVNNKGALLPETGGIGTTIFYVLGGLLVAAAVVLLVTKKRMASAE